MLCGSEVNLIFVTLDRKYIHKPHCMLCIRYEFHKNELSSEPLDTQIIFIKLCEHIYTPIITFSLSAFLSMCAWTEPRAFWFTLTNCVYKVGWCASQVLYFSCWWELKSSKQLSTYIYCRLVWLYHDIIFMYTHMLFAMYVLLMFTCTYTAWCCSSEYRCWEGTHSGC